MKPTMAERLSEHFTRMRYSGLPAPTRHAVKRLLLDYLEPIASPDQLFTAPAAGAQTAGTTNVVISLAVRRNVGGQILNLPATDRYTLTAYPRNVGKPVLPN